jgi:structural maintenance of chromosome 4
VQSFSSVVGPNGSGKSNVIDAMLFVFGKRAKQLRLNKVSELIHNSTHHRDLDQARVSVHFQEIADVVSARRTPGAVPRALSPARWAVELGAWHAWLQTILRTLCMAAC